MTDFARKSKTLGKQTETNEKSPSAFFSMYVIDVITDPSTVKLSTLNNFKPLMEFPDALEKMPAGSILAVKLADGKPEGELIKVVLPFFSSHISYPIKAGEVAWCMQDEVGQCFYLSRKHSVSKYEDANYTANLRNRTITPDKGKTETVDKFKGNPPKESSPKSFSFPPVSEKPSPKFTTALDISRTDSFAHFKGEAVPRHKTKPADFSLQGSNNTLIELGTDSTTGKKEHIGAINIVAGRGMDDSTKPLIASNARNFQETDKQSEKQNMQEGVYDYINDSSRIVVTMNSDIDDKFKIDVKSLDEELPLNTSYSMKTGSEEKILPAIVSKSTNQLMIGRAEGTVRIVHESGSSIVMDENGNIQIQCAEDGQIRIGASDASVEKAVIGNTLNEMILAVVSEMITNAPQFVATGVGPGILSPKILTALTEFQAKLQAEENLSEIIKVE